MLTHVASRSWQLRWKEEENGGYDNVGDSDLAGSLVLRPSNNVGMQGTCDVLGQSFQCHEDIVAPKASDLRTYIE